MTTTYTKLKSGDWGIRVQGEVIPGQQIIVTKKSGETKTETVDRVLFTKDGIAICSVKAKLRRSSGDYPGKMCPQCGSEPLDDNLECWECGYAGGDE